MWEFVGRGTADFGIRHGERGGQLGCDDDGHRHHDSDDDEYDDNVIDDVVDHDDDDQSVDEYDDYDGASVRCRRLDGPVGDGVRGLRECRG